MEANLKTTGNLTNGSEWNGYYLDDLECSLCAHYRGRKLGCMNSECLYEAEKKNAFEHGKIKRPKKGKQ